jgi:molecular chaperone GrpE
LLAQFIALRHEVNLQTRATRAQQEQNVVTLEDLRAALDLLRRSQEGTKQADRESQDEIMRPLLKTLIDVNDALALAEREVRRLRENVQTPLEQLTTPAASPPATRPRATSFWSRILGGGSAFREPLALQTESAPAEAERLQRQETAARVRQLLESVLTGYTMSLQRLERALHQSGLDRISCVGEAFDPEKMEVVAVAAGTGRPPGEVVEEARRGYLWRGRVFRYAQVCVAKDTESNANRHEAS